MVVGDGVGVAVGVGAVGISTVGVPSAVRATGVAFPMAYRRPPSVLAKVTYSLPGTIAPPRTLSPFSRGKCHTGSSWSGVNALHSGLGLERERILRVPQT